MKKLIFRRFSIDIAGFFLLSVVSIGLIVWIIQAVNYLDFVSEDGHSLKVYFMYSVLSLPKIVGKRRNIQIGDNVMIMKDVELKTRSKGRIVIDNNVKIDKCFLNKGILNIPLQIQKPNKSK